jgi:hypothetical protein
MWVARQSLYAATADGWTNVAGEMPGCSRPDGFNQIISHKCHLINAKDSKAMICKM